MADRLEIDFDALDHASGRLSSIKSSLEGTAQMSARIADHTGHAALGAAIVYFAGKWAIHRGDMIDAVDALHKSLDKIHKTFGDTDTQLADNLSGDATTAPSGGAGRPKAV